MTERTEILLVDDEPALRELMKVALGDGYRFLEAGDVDAALALLHAHVPAVVLLDVMLPGGSGLDVLRAIRADPVVSPARVVIVSAWQSADDRQTALELGADAFLAKPFSVDELVSVVADLAGEVA